MSSKKNEIVLEISCILLKRNLLNFRQKDLSALKRFLQKCHQASTVRNALCKGLKHSFCLALKTLCSAEVPRHQRSSKQHGQQRSKDLVSTASQDSPGNMDVIWTSYGFMLAESRERWFKLRNRKTKRPHNLPI